MNDRDLLAYMGRDVSKTMHPAQLGALKGEGWAQSATGTPNSSTAPTGGGRSDVPIGPAPGAEHEIKWDRLWSDFIGNPNMIGIAGAGLAAVLGLVWWKKKKKARK